MSHWLPRNPRPAAADSGDSATIAPPGQEGWLRQLRKSRAASLAAQTGWWFNIREKDPQFKDRKTLRQKLRHNATPAEKALWHNLKNSNLGVKFRRQHGVGPYVLDFYCPERNLAIEIEGGIHGDVLRQEYDAERHAYLESQGIQVLYFKNRTLLEVSDYVVELIKSALLEPPPRLRR